ncbi:MULTISPECIES: hypothetical protein [unclassified Beijerinckia]|uniref:SecDF P1 head subdomain-containing protein n=1 Tax=unclassified Beijerinckia TaxID=2638183 RepID=UPI0011146E6A|nr:MULTISPECIES: hypothetical protein [unclassified Beijerinckia]
MLTLPQIALGLDPKAGARVVFEVDSNDVLRGQLEQLKSDIGRILREQRVRSLAGPLTVSGRTVQFRINDPSERARVRTKLSQQPLPTDGDKAKAEALPTPDVREDADGQVVVAVTEASTQELIRRAAERSIEVIYLRAGTGEMRKPNIERQGVNRILVQVPGVPDTKRLIDLLGMQAKLEFRLVATPGYKPADVDMLNEYERTPDGKGERIVTTYPVEKLVMVQGEDLVDAQQGFDSGNGEPVVNFRFNTRGGQRLSEVTSQNVGRPFVMVLDNKVISAPRILTAITSGSGQISGRFTVQQANDLAILLRAGALPAKLTVVEE